MNKEAVMIDFSLPNNPNTLKFIKLNQSDKLKAVALGMRFLSTGTQQLQMWDNSQWETRIEQLKTQKQDKIDSLQEKLQLEQLKTQKLIQRQQEELNVIIEGVRNRTESKFLGEIASLNDNLERMHKRIQSQEKHKDELYKSINNEFYTKLLSKEQHWEGKIDKLRHYYETKLESERERTAACILTTKTFNNERTGW